MPTPAIQSIIFFKQNDDGQNHEFPLVVTVNGILGTGADKVPVMIPKSYFATAVDLASHLADLANPHAVSAAQVGLGNVLNVAQIPAADRGANSGIATLDINGKLTTAQIPASLLGAMVYQTTWNATTNTPAIPAAAAGNNGWYYRVAVAGGTTIDGISEWAVNDFIVSNGTIWEKIDNTEAVSSVCGKSGAVTLVVGDITGLSTALDALTADKENIQWVKKSTTYTAVRGDKILADNASAAWTLTLPATPAEGDPVQVRPHTTWTTHNLTINGNGHNIEGDSTLVCNADKELHLCYNGSQWKFFYLV